jgi:tRNA-2-methylthio-N6-dimethylallyladenosine synthase
MNKADSTYLSQVLEVAGYVPSAEIELADVVILNTCVVRQSAENRVYGRLHSLQSLKKQRPEIKVILMGCIVGNNLEELKRRFPIVDHFVPPSEYMQLVDILPNARGHGDKHALESSPTKIGTRVTAYVPVMNGCDNYCTYCIVPYRRGPERSRPLVEVVSEICQLAKEGVREVTLLGQKVDSYGHDLDGRPELADLLIAVSEIRGLARIRFLTSHPNNITDRLISAVSELPNACEYFNLPVQSGDDAILAAMRRGYNVEQYRNVLHKIRAAIPTAALATDVIVGFPGETENQFLNTLGLVKEMRFETVHTAAFSPRPGTEASLLADDVPLAEKDRRKRAVEEVQQQLLEQANAALIGTVVEVLAEGIQKGTWSGRTRGNRLVFFDAAGDMAGSLMNVRVTETSPWWLRGEVVAGWP